MKKKANNDTADFEYIISLYQKENGKKAWTNMELAEFALKHNWRAPKPKTEQELLANKFSRLARQATKIDEETHLPYRSYQAFKNPFGADGQGLLWLPTDDATREQMEGAKTFRRDQCVGDLFQLNADVDHWNRKNPNEKPIGVDNNFEPDVQEKMAAYSDEDAGIERCDDADLEEF